MALYHKYRPQKFTDIVGQEHIVQTIQNQISSGRTAHAYLFFGPRGVGKTTLARILAKSLNCPNRQTIESDPCDNCDTCREIANARSIDVIEIDAASHTQVDNVRENIIENSQFKPTKSKYKIFIIDEVHMLSNASFNALLKTLEEPPSHVMFILATTDPQKLPATIISRCQRFSFLRIPTNLMKTQIEKIADSENFKIDRAVIDRIIAKSEGCDRDALGLLEQLFSLGEKHITSELSQIFLPPSFDNDALTLISSLAEFNIEKSLQTINGLTENSANFIEFIDALIGILRDLLHTKIDNQYENGANVSETRSIAAKLTLHQIVTLSDIFSRRRLEIKTSPIPSLPLELGAVEWCTRDETNITTPTPAPNTSPVREKKKGADINITSTETKIPNEEIPKTIKDEIETEELPVTPETTIEIGTIWPNFLKAVEMKNPALIFILKMATVNSCTDQILNISVPYEFHCAKLAEKTTKHNLEQILAEISGHKIKFVISVNQTNPETNHELSNLTADFGGTVIA